MTVNARSWGLQFMVYRRDRDVPAWSQWRTAGCHLAQARRVVERLPNVHLVACDYGTYRRWLGSRQDSDEQRAVVGEGKHARLAVHLFVA